MTNKVESRAAWRRYWSCERKIRYDSRMLASNMALLLSFRDGKPRVFYKCRYCPGWHTAREVQEDAA